MFLAVRTIGLLLLATCTSGLSAQVVSYPGPAGSTHTAAPAAYQQTVGSPESANVDERLQSTPSAEPLPLKAHSPASRADSGKPPSGLQSVATVGGSLALVLGIFFAIAWAIRRASPGSQGTLPGEAFEVLGRGPLANRQQVHLLRCGNKLLLVSVTPTGAQPLTEISDPAEVERLSGLCRQTRSPAASFRQVFRQLEGRNG